MATVATRSLTSNISEAAYNWLVREAHATGLPLDELAGVLIEEARRVEQFKGLIFFRNGGGGRRAVIHGGIDVWEIIMLYQDHGREGMREVFENIHPSQIDNALAYYEAYPDEIDAILWENSQPMEYWLEKYPVLRAQVREV